MSAELAKVDQADDREALASILNELAVDADESSDRSRARRIVGDVVSAWPGAADDRWMVWASESGQSLGRPARIVDCTAEQAIDLAHHGSAVIARPQGPDSWIAFVGGDSSRVRCLQPLGRPPSALVKRGQAVRTLRKLCDRDIVRFVILDTTHLHAAEPTSSKQDKSEFEAEASFFVDVPLQRRKGQGKMQAAQGKLAQLAAKRRFVEDKIVASVQSAYIARIAAYEQVLQAKEAVRLAEDLAIRERRNFEAGASDLLKVTLREQYAVESAYKEVEALLLYYRSQADYVAAMAQDLSAGPAR